MSLDKDTKIYRKFIISVGIALALCISAIFIGLGIRSRQLIHDSLLYESRAHFKNILLTRKWNANYGGVYVEKKQGVESSPYLENPDIETVDGRILTKRHPAFMTREISEYAEREGLFQFHITSLNPINPDNSPDTFETKALKLFEQGEKELVDFEVKNNRRHMRYMAPLYVEAECLDCHEKQGYKLGQVRGGISVTFDIEDVEEELGKDLMLIFFFAITIITLIMGLVYLLIKQFLQTLSRAREDIEKMAITDGLTELFNRRHILKRFDEEFERAKRAMNTLGCILLDVDHFKEINDRHGHLVGDQVLKSLAAVMKDSVRTYDAVGRYGGEEFLVVLPNTGFSETRNLAQRIRANIRENLSGKTNGSNGFDVKVSLGVSSLRDQDNSAEDVLRRADEGLYKAKESGRDRVEWIPEEG